MVIFTRKTAVLNGTLPCIPSANDPVQRFPSGPAVLLEPSHEAAFETVREQWMEGVDADANLSDAFQG